MYFTCESLEYIRSRRVCFFDKCVRASVLPGRCFFYVLLLRFVVYMK
nr:MAG TPA: hypothetical protein [Bacteriophage sp.]